MFDPTPPRCQYCLGMNKCILKTSTAIAFAWLFCASAIAETFSVKSPDGKLEAIVNDGSKLTFTLKADGKTLMNECVIGMDTDKGKIGVDAKATGSALTSHDGVIDAPWGIRKQIKDKYNQLEIDFKGYKLIVRAYDEAVAYRFSTDLGSGDMIVFDETLKFPFADSDRIIAHFVKGPQDSFERAFIRGTVADMKNHHSASMPFLYMKDGYTVAMVESDLWGYPGIRVNYPKLASMPQALFSKKPKTLVQSSNFIRKVGEEEKYIAKTSATREFPWRAFIVARKDIDLADNDTVYKLARPSVIKDTSWIKPGTCVWEWWNNWNLEGVDFKTGLNEETYRYLIDYAAENNIPYVLFDAGWLTGADVGEMDKNIDEAMRSGKPFVDVPALIKYAHEKDVKILLWVLAQSIDKYAVEGFDRMKQWGADGVKIDFTDRDDQQAIEFFERMSKLAAERKMVVDFHGCPKPAGLQRTYPNTINFEGVHGCEFNKFSPGLEPSHNIDLVYTRMLQGPMDYTPGAMTNVAQKEFKTCSNQPQAKGTRAHMVSMYVLYYAPVQMMCDSATEYLKAPDILNFIANTPTTWDDTKALDGKIGEFVVVARRSGDNWYVGGMNDWNEREVEIDFSKILPEDTEYKAEIIRDSVNSNKLARDYKREFKDVDSTTKMKITMKKGGGFAIKLTPKEFEIFGVGLF